MKCKINGIEIEAEVEVLNQIISSLLLNYIPSKPIEENSELVLMGMSGDGKEKKIGQGNFSSKRKWSDFAIESLAQEFKMKMGENGYVDDFAMGQIAKLFPQRTISAVRAAITSFVTGNGNSVRTKLGVVKDIRQMLGLTEKPRGVQKRKKKNITKEKMVQIKGEGQIKVPKKFVYQG